MTTQNSAMGDELRDLEQYVKAGYLGALRSDGSSFTDVTAIVFSNHVMARVTGLLSMAEKSRDQQIALADLAWCLGKLRGLGYPAELLEKKYGVKQPQNKEK